MTRHGIKDLIVVIERTGRYHGPIQRAFANAGFEVRILHPYTTKQFRQPADPGNKTDDTDLSAIHRAAVNGFGLLEHEPDPIFVRLQLLARHRRRLVQKNVMLRQQMLEHLHSYMPGYARCFTDIFDSEILLWVAKNLGSAAEILQAGIDGLAQQLRKENIRSHKPTLEKIVAWARSAPSAEEPALLHRRFFIELDADRLAKLQVIRAIESELAETLESDALHSASEYSWNQRRLGGRIRGRDGTDQALCQGPSHYRQSRFVPVAVSERRGRSSQTVRWCDAPTTTCGVRSS